MLHSIYYLFTKNNFNLIISFRIFFKIDQLKDLNIIIVTLIFFFELHRKNA